jgi:hypothetical protein
LNFLIRPLNINAKFRTDLTQNSALPQTTISLEISPFIVSVDFTIVTEIESLLKLKEWHCNNIDQKMAFTHKPRYLLPVKGHTKAYWKFAILNIRNIVKQKSISPEQQTEDINKLVELLKLEMINKYYDSNNLPDRK